MKNVKHLGIRILAGLVFLLYLQVAFSLVTYLIRYTEFELATGMEITMIVVGGAAVLLAEAGLLGMAAGLTRYRRFRRWWLWSMLVAFVLLINILVKGTYWGRVDGWFVALAFLGSLAGWVLCPTKLDKKKMARAGEKP